MCSHVFELGDLRLLGNTQFFTPYRRFPLITLHLGMLCCLFFQSLKGHRFFDVCAEWRNLKESFFKVGGLFLPITSPILVTLTRFLSCTLRKVRSTSTLKSFYRHCYIFKFITHLLMDK